MARSQWTDAEKDFLLSMPLASPDELREAFPDRTLDSITSKMARLGMSRTSESVQSGVLEVLHEHPDFATPPVAPLNVLGWLDRVARRTELSGPKIDKDYARVVIETDEPIAIMKTADWHFGGIDVDYRAFERHVRLLYDTPGFYQQIVGDAINLMTLHRIVATRTEILSPEEQFEFLHSFIHETVGRGKLISVTGGNHDDEFSERSVGFGILKVIAKGKVPYFRGHGYLDLVIRNSKGEEYTYPMALAHKTRFSSFMNPLHGNKRMQQQVVEFFGPGRPIPREFITAHTHNPAMMTEGLLPEDRIIHIKCGTYKTDCTYSQRFFGQGRIGVPTVVYFADRQEHIGLPSPYAAYRYITGKELVV
jgi:hypothetical protein